MTYSSTTQQSGQHRTDENNQNSDNIHSGLEPLAPDEAIRMYLSERESELRSTSLRSHHSALKFLARWCSEEADLQNLNELTGRHLHQYRIWRREVAPTKTDTLAKHTEHSQQKIIRQFVKFCEQLDGVQPGLHTRVRIPKIPEDEVARSAVLDPERANEILDWLEQFSYATREHVTWVLLTHTGARISVVHGLDTDDYVGNDDQPHLKVRHRPQTGTQLKTGKKGERLIALDSSACRVIEDYLDHHREDVEDGFGRTPLITTRYGRVSKNTIRKYVYKLTRPCFLGQPCPHGRDVEDCEATEAVAASKCPSSRSPHTIRRGYITHQLATDVEPSYVAGRCDVTEEVLSTHYDVRSQRQQMEVRRRALRQARDDFADYGGR